MTTCKPTNSPIERKLNTDREIGVYCSRRTSITRMMVYIWANWASAFDDRRLTFRYFTFIEVILSDEKVKSKRLQLDLV